MVYLNRHNNRLTVQHIWYSVTWSNYITTIFIYSLLLEDTSKDIFLLLFNTYPFLESTILDSRSTIYWVNLVDLLILGLFKETLGVKYIEASTIAYIVLRIGTRVLKNVLNSAYRPLIEDLTLENVIIIEGFYINIILEARLL